MKKLSERNGVTIVNALAVFLSVTLFSATMVGIGLAAVSNARAAAEAEHALRIIQQGVENTKITYEVKYEKPSEHNHYQEHLPSSEPDAKTYNSTGTDEAIQQALLDMITTMDSPTPSKPELMITVEVPADVPAFAPVKVKMELDSSTYSISAAFTEMRKEETGTIIEADQPYKLTLRFSGSVSEQTDKGTYTKTYRLDDGTEEDLEYVYDAKEHKDYTWSVAGVNG